MLVIKDKWGEIVFESENYEEIVKFAKTYKKQNKLTSVEVLKKSGGHHSFI